MVGREHIPLPHPPPIPYIIRQVEDSYFVEHSYYVYVYGAIVCIRIPLFFCVWYNIISFKSPSGIPYLPSPSSLFCLQCYLFLPSPYHLRFLYVSPPPSSQKFSQDRPPSLRVVILPGFFHGMNKSYQIFCRM